MSIEGWSEVQITIAGQIDHMKPDALVPGRDVFMVNEDDGTLTVITADQITNVRYDAGADHYEVKRKLNAEDEWGESLHRVYFDQLGELAFGSEAKPYTLPSVMLSTDDGESWEIIA